jgi:integrase
VDFTFCHNGEYVRLRQQGFPSSEEAASWVDKQYHGIRLGFESPPEKGVRPGRKKIKKTSITVAEFYEMIKPKWEALAKGTRQGYTYCYVKHIAPVIGKKQFAALTPPMIHLIYEKVTDNTKNVVTNVIKNMMSHALSFGVVAPVLPQSTWVYVKPVKREAYFSPEELEIFLANARPDMAPVLMLMAYTGIRLGEAMGLRWENIHIAKDGRHTVNICRQKDQDGEIQPTKTKKNRIIPLHPSAYEALRQMAKLKGATWIVSGYIYNSHRRGLEAEVRRLRAFFPNKPDANKIVVHSLRHTCASLMIQAGQTLEKIGKILGQSTARVTEQYGHLCTESVRDAMNSIPAVSAFATLDI